MLRCVLEEEVGRMREGTDGDADGEVDMRSLSGSSEAFLLRPDMLNRSGHWLASLYRTCGMHSG